MVALKKKAPDQSKLDAAEARIASLTLPEGGWPPKADLGAAIQCAYDIQCAPAGNLMPQRILGDQGNHFELGSME